MEHSLTVRDQPVQAESMLRQDALDPAALERYYHQSVQANRLVEAAETLERLDQRFPGEPNVQKLKIALCLERQDYSAALALIETQISGGCSDDGLVDAALVVRRSIGPMTIENRSPGRVTLSLCMIVKDEMKGLGACLHVAKKMVDEIIVVDTGSADRSQDIADIFGAKTYSYSWKNDFSAARNQAISRASGDWILILDADEIIASCDHAGVRKILEQTRPGTTAFTIETRNYSYVTNAYGWQANDGTYPEHEAGLGWVPSRKVRIFPNMEAVKFRFPVHERVEPTLGAAGIRVAELPIPVHHYGDLNYARKLDKAKTYFQIGKAKLKQSQNDPTAVRELAIQAGELEIWDEAIALWQRLLECRPDYVEAHVNIAGAHWQLGHYTKALQAAQHAARLDPSVKEAWFNVAVSHLMLGRADKAADLLEALTGQHTRYLSAHFMAAAAYGCMGKLELSRRRFDYLQGIYGTEALFQSLQDLIVRLERERLGDDALKLGKLSEHYAGNPAHGA